MTVWYIARGAALSAVVLLTLATALGAVVSLDPRPARRYVGQYAHRALAGLGLTALVTHVIAILADSYAHVGWLGALVPLRSGYRPVGVALGTLALWVLLAVSVLGLARGRLAVSPRAARTWRAVHSLAYLAWGLGVLHGLLVGTDATATWVRVLFLASALVVAGAVGVRVAALRTATRPAVVLEALR